MGRLFPYTDGVSGSDRPAQGHRSREPTPDKQSIKRCVMGLILLDAVLATVYAGVWGLLIALLLAPQLLGKRVYST